MIPFRTILYELVFILAGVSILAFNLLFIAEMVPIMVPVLNIVGALIAIVPPFLIFYTRYKKSRDIEEQFIIFIMDLTESINSGMTLPMALKYSSKRDYRSLTPYVREISNKVDWGVPFHEVLTMFAKKSKSNPIKRSVSTIIATHKAGGKIADTLRAIGKSLIEIDKINKERSASVQSQIVTSYMIFFVFIFILIILQTFLIPALGTQSPGLSEAGITSGAAESESTKLYSEAFVNFIIVQGFFAGLATGKMAEGSVVAGFKHSIVLIVIGYTLFSIASHINIGFLIS
jgi:flagellar protein FlaJ